MEEVSVSQKKRFNVAQNSSNGHFLKGAEKVVQVDNAEGNYLIIAKQGTKIVLETENHGTLEVIKGKGALVVVRQDDVNEITGKVRARLD